jgi:hypothetical protein
MFSYPWKTGTAAGLQFSDALLDGPFIKEMPPGTR